MSLPKKIKIPLIIIAVFALLFILGPIIKRMNEAVESRIAEENFKKDISSENPKSDMGKELQEFTKAAMEIQNKHLAEKLKLDLSSISSTEDLKNTTLVTKVATKLRSGHEIDVKYFDALIELFSQQEKKLQDAKNSKGKFEEGFLDGALQSIVDQQKKLNLLKEAESNSFLAHRKFFKWVLEHQSDITVKNSVLSLSSVALQKEYDELGKNALTTEEAYTELQK